MLVMAVQASRQLAAPDKTITGFRFKDVSLPSFATVPDESTDGADTHCFLRPLRESATSRSATWSESRLYTWTGDSWLKSCSGLVSVEYETEDTPVDAGLEQQRFIARCRHEATAYSKKTPEASDRSFVYNA